MKKKKNKNIKAKRPIENKQNPDNLTFIQHAQELRIRLLISLAVVFILFFVLFSFSENILKIITEPLTKLGFKLYSLKVYEKLTATIKASFFASLICSFPIILWILLGFILPALTGREKRLFILILFAGFTFIIAGFYFSYRVLIPISLKYLLSFGNKEIENMITIQFYLDYFLILFFSTGLGFQLPLVMLLLSKIGIVNYKMLSKGRGIAIIVILIASAIITPSVDIFTQLALSIPLYFLYELGLLFILIFNRKKVKQD